MRVRAVNASPVLGTHALAAVPSRLSKPQPEVVSAWLRPASPSGAAATRNYQPRQEHPNRRAPAPRSYPAHDTQVGSQCTLMESEASCVLTAALVRNGDNNSQETRPSTSLGTTAAHHTWPHTLLRHFAAATTGPLPLNANI